MLWRATPRQDCLVSRVESTGSSSDFRTPSAHMIRMRAEANSENPIQPASNHLDLAVEPKRKTSQPANRRFLNRIAVEAVTKILTGQAGKLRMREGAQGLFLFRMKLL